MGSNKAQYDIESSKTKQTQFIVTADDSLHVKTKKL
jgi:hypothetical protein